jgi:RNA polymerase sigma-70 factor (ECF subfamily)
VFTHSAVIPARDDDSDLPSLIDGARSGRRAALERLAARVHMRVRMWAARFSADEDTADDIAQDVLIDLERRIQRFDGRSKFSTWLFSVTRNVALSHREREARRARLLAGRETAPDAIDEHRDQDAAQLAELVLRYYAELPPRQRMIFELADIRGMSPAEIARDLGMEQATVRAHLFKARRAIRSRMLEQHERMLKEYRS